MAIKDHLISISEWLARASIVGIGFHIGGTIGESIVMALGIELTGSILDNGLSKLKWKWLSSKDGILNHDIQQALVRAFIKALEKLEEKYFALEETKKLPKEKKEAIETLFQELKDEAQTIFLPSIKKVINEQEVKRYLYGKPQEAKNALWKRIDETNLIYTYYGEHFKNFLRENSLNEVVFWFGEELKTDNKECNKAWRAFQRMLLEGIQADVKAVQAGQNIIQRDLQTLNVIRELLDKIKDAIDYRLPSEPFQEAFTKALTDIQSILKVVTQTTTRTEGKIDTIADGVKKLLGVQPRHAPVFQLPSPPLDFIGREDELNELRALVKSGNVMISSLHGMGGVGKTALALKIAEEFKDDYPDGQIYLDLKGVSRRSESGLRQEPLTSVEVMSHVLHAWLPEEKLPDRETELAGRYRTVLADKRALLLFDNARNTAQLTPLIPGNRQCLLLVTSRQRFTLGGREPYNIDKLKPEDAVKLLRNNSSRLSEQDAKEIAEICDYLPMALKPAVSLLSNSRSLTPEKLIKKLGDKKQLLSLKDAERKDDMLNISIEASFQLSYELLAVDTIGDLPQRWRTLAVFPDTFDEAAAAAVWALDEDATREALDALDSYSLIEITKSADGEALRYGLHDLARDFADAQLNEEEREVAGRRHADYFYMVLNLSNHLYEQGKEAILRGLGLFDKEHSNIEAGEIWAAARAGNEQRAAELCVGYPNTGAYVLDLRLHPHKLIRWLEAALTAARKIKHREAESVIFSNLGVAYWNLGDVRKAIKCHEQALVIGRETGNPMGEGMALNNLGLAYTDLGEMHKAIEYYEQALVIHHEIGDRRTESLALCNLGNAYFYLGEARKTVRFYEQALEIDRELGNRRGEGQTLGNLGNAYFNLGEVRQAIESHEQALLINIEIGDRRSQGIVLGNLGSAYLGSGEVRQAIGCYTQQLEISLEIDDQLSKGYALGNLGEAYFHLGEVRRAISYHEQALVIRREIGDRRGEGIDFGNLGKAYAYSRETHKAIEFYKQALVIHREISNRNDEAKTLLNLSLACDELDDRAQAIAYAEASLKICKEIEAPLASKVRVKLAEWHGEAEKQ